MPFEQEPCYAGVHIGVRDEQALLEAMILGLQNYRASKYICVYELGVLFVVSLQEGPYSFLIQESTLNQIRVLAMVEVSSLVAVGASMTSIIVMVPFS